MNTSAPPLPHLITEAQRHWELQRKQRAEQQRHSMDAAAAQRAYAEEKLERLLATTMTKSKAFRAELAALPPARECRVHAGQQGLLVEEASFEAGRAVYRCRLCIRDRTNQRIERRMIAAGIPADVRHATLENFATEREDVKVEAGFSAPAKFLEAARDFAGRKVRNLLLCGSPGIGKGHLAAAVALARLTDGWPVAWVMCQQLFRDWHAAYSAEGPERIQQRLIGANLLVLDEVAMRDLPADGEEILFSILDGRHKSGLPTCLLSNAKISEVKRWLGDRIVDRLRSGKTAALYGEWRSMRGECEDGGNEVF